MAREAPRNGHSLSCFYCQVPVHLSRDCPLRIRHQAEKQAKLERSRAGPADVQMITLEEEKMRMENVLVGITDSLPLTRAQKSREQPEIPKKEEKSKNN